MFQIFDTWIVDNNRPSSLTENKSKYCQVFENIRMRACVT